MIRTIKALTFASLPLFLVYAGHFHHQAWAWRINFVFMIMLLVGNMQLWNDYIHSREVPPRRTKVLGPVIIIAMTLHMLATIGFGWWCTAVLATLNTLYAVSFRMRAAEYWKGREAEMETRFRSARVIR